MTLMNTFIIDRKYIGFLSGRLRNFQNKGNGTSTFTHSCERSDSRKRRGYMISGKTGMIMKCHNCGQCLSLGNFLKNEDPTLAKEYRLECFKEGIYGDYKEETKTVPAPPPVLIERASTEFIGLQSFTEIPPSNPAYRYLTRRMIPTKKIEGLYIARQFYKWASQFEPIFKKFPVDHPRLVIPYYDVEKKLLGFVCRAFGKEAPKYIQLRLDKEKEFIFGTDTVDSNKKFIALEGQIDSMFLDNAIAVGNANYGARFLEKHKDNAIIVPDNDWRRNPQVCAQLKKAIDNDFAVCLLPSHWKKDINDIVKSGIDKDEIQTYIFNHTKRGASALLEYTLEKRC